VVFTEILTKAPTSPVRLNPDVPDQLENTINKCLEKDSEIRCQSAKELLLDLKRLKRDTSGESISAAVPAVTPPAKRSYLWPVLGGGVVVLLLLALLLPLTVTAPTEAIDSIAILPFENRSGDPELEYVSDGIAEGIINRLSQLPSLNKVIASSSVRGYKGRTVDAATVTQEVDVRAVVMGSMVQLGDNIRVNVQLIDGENNSAVWGDSYTRPRSALYELEETLSKEIADALGIQLTGEQGERLTRRYTDDSEAHEAYLKGRSELSKGSYPKAIQHFEKAIEQDPNYAPAYTALAYTYRSAGTRSMPPQEVMPKAEEMAMKALELDNTLGGPHAVLGDVRRRYYWDWAGAEEEFKLAMELDPSSYEAPYGYAFLMSGLGRHDEAVALIRRAQQVDPLNVRTRSGAARVLYWAGRYEEALEQSQVALEMAPNYPELYNGRGNTYETMGLYEEAARAWQKEQILGGASEEEVSGLSEAATRGKEGYWQWQLEYFRDKAKKTYVPTATFATCYAELGQMDQVFEWLEKAYEERSPALIWLNVSPRWDPLRDDPRFQDLLRRMNLEP